jgi:hypothetical protein
MSVSARYVKISVLDGYNTSSNNGCFIINELAIYDTTGANVAKNKTATASSVRLGTYLASRAVDGIVNFAITNAWVSEIGTGYQNLNGSTWLQVDLGQSYNISYIDIATYAASGACSIRNFDCLISSNGTEWTTLSQVRNAVESYGTNVIMYTKVYDEGLSGAISARYIKVSINDAFTSTNNGLITINEFQAFDINGINVALNKTATASSFYYGTQVPGLAVDGSFNHAMMWISDQNTGWKDLYGSTWWKVDLGQIYSINTILAYTNSDVSGYNYPVNYNVLVSTDGTTWTVLKGMRSRAPSMDVYEVIYDRKRKYTLANLSVGDYIECEYEAAVGAKGRFKNLGLDSPTEARKLPENAGTTPNGKFNLYCVERKPGIGGLLIADRILQHSVTWTVLHTDRLIFGSPHLYKNGFLCSPVSNPKISSGYFTPNSNHFRGTGALPLVHNATDFTIEAVVKLTLNNVDQSIFTLGIGNCFLSYGLNTSGKNSLVMGDGATWGSAIAGNQTVPTGVEVTLKIIKIGSNVSFYYNGALDVTRTYSTLVPLYSCFYIGVAVTNAAETTFAQYTKGGIKRVTINGMDVFNVSSGANLIVRAPTGGNTWADASGKSVLVAPSPEYGAFPNSNEWDKYCVNSTLNGTMVAGDNSVWHWNNYIDHYSMESANPNISGMSPNLCVMRSTDSAHQGIKYFYPLGTLNYAGGYAGYRPVIEFKD